MKAFQMFSNPHPPVEPFFGWMQRVRDLSEAYTLIAPQNFMGPRARFVPISAVWAELPEVLRANTNGPLMGFDAMRVLYLSRHFDLAYFDLDVELLAPIEVEDQPQKAGPGVLVGNGDATLGARCWETYLAMAPNFCRPASLMFSGIPHKSLDGDPRFIHHYAHGAYF